MINRRFKNYFDKNELNDEQYDELIHLKHDIFKALDVKNLNESDKLQEELISKNYPKNKFTDKLIWEFIIPYYRKLTRYLENTNISSTNNKIENIFQKVFLKHIKRTMKIEQGISTRFMLKLNYWNIKNAKEKNHTSF